MTTPVTQYPKRGSCLTTFLILMLIANPLVGLFYLYTAFQAYQSPETATAPIWFLVVYAVLCLANVYFALMIWRWKRWGMYGYAASALIAFIVNYLASPVKVITAQNSYGFLGVAILSILLYPVWGKMSRR